MFDTAKFKCLLKQENIRFHYYPETQSNDVLLNGCFELTGKEIYWTLVERGLR